MVDLAIGYYNEHPTMVEESICKSWFFGLRTLTMPMVIQHTELYNVFATLGKGPYFLQNKPLFWLQAWNIILYGNNGQNFVDRHIMYDMSSSILSF